MQDALTPFPLRVAYLGPPTSFSHQAAREAFPDPAAATLHPLPSFASIIDAVQKSAPVTREEPRGAQDEDQFDFALLPVENSTNGGVVQVLDLLMQCGLDSDSSLYPDVQVVAEHYLEVHHCLYIHRDVTRHSASGIDGRNLSDIINGLNITTLYSHAQVWGQCNNFLAKYLPPPRVERIDVSSTSAAALFVATNSSPPAAAPALNVPSSDSTAQTSDDTTSTIGAICSSLAGTQHNLTCLATNIEDEPGKNETRFLIVRNRRRNLMPATGIASSSTHNHPNPQFYKSLISLSIPNDQLGALAAALAVFSAHAFNLTTITARPSRTRNWHYVFFVECVERQEGGGDANGDKRTLAMLVELETLTERVCLLGRWADSRRNA